MDSLSTRTWPFLLVLVIQNLIVYRGHYFRDVGFPWDFCMSYYAMVAFWTAGVGQGVFPQWVPFQQMGYPFALQVQSGVNYLPLWIFPALNIPYTLHAAIVFQCVHVLFGSIGMFMLARQVQQSSTYALIAAVAFQFFGGFYSNAEHVDIVRAFACAPWLLYVFALGDTLTGRLPRRMRLIPLVLYLFFTGGYPGNVFASGLIVGLFLILQFGDALVRGASPSVLTSRAARIAALGALGCGMAVLQLAPVWLFRDQFFRGAPLASVPRETLWLDHLPGLFLSNKTLPGEISMTSTFVTLPIPILACFVPLSALKRHWIYPTLAVFAALMAAGDRTPVGQLMKAAIPVLGLSRFPSSDYRVFVAIPIILLAILGLRAVVEKQLPASGMVMRSALCLAWMSWGLLRVHGSSGSATLMAIGLGAMSLVAIVALWRGPARLTLAGLAAVCLLVAGDAVRVLPDIPGWHQEAIDDYYLSQRYPPYTRNRGRQLVAQSSFRNQRETRPPRIVPVGLIRWSGYLDGRYYTTDLTPNVLRAANTIASNAAYQQYMLMAWTPLLLPPQGSDHAPIVLGTEELTRLAAASATQAVTQTQYGINEITYHVSLTEPAVLVENEVYFPGWRARLTLAGGDRTIDAMATNGVFRSWALPAGNYTMTASFSFPHVFMLRVICAACFLVYAGLWLVVRRRDRLGRQ